MSENTPQEDTRMSLADLAKLKAEAPAAAPVAEEAPAAAGLLARHAARP